MASGQNPTIRQISAATGFSIATVSEALRDSPRVKQATREKIHAKASEMGYRKNPLVATLMSQIKRGKPVAFRPMVALIGEDAKGTQAVYSHAQRVRAGVREQAERHGYRTRYFSLDDIGKNLVNLNAILRRQNIPGAVLLEGSTGREELRHINFNRVALVAAAYEPDWFNIHCIAPDRHRGMQQAITGLLRLGYERIGYYCSRTLESKSEFRWASAAHFAFYINDLPHRNAIHLHNGLNRDDFMRWFESYQPDGLISGAVEAYEWLQDAGVQVPRDVGISFLHHSEGIADASYLDQRGEAIGRFAMDLVVAQINHNERGVPHEPKLQLVEGEWIEGSTTRPQNAAARSQRATA